MKRVQKSDAAHWQEVQYSTYSTRVLRGVNVPGRGNLVASLSAQIFFLVRVLLLISPQKTAYFFLCVGSSGAASPAFLTGIILVFLKWPIFMVAEMFEIQLPRSFRVGVPRVLRPEA